MSVGEGRERQVAGAVLGGRFCDARGVRIAGVNQASAALEQALGQRRGRGADEQHAATAGDGLSVGGKNDGRLDGARHDGARSLTRIERARSHRDFPEK